jgi:hypothetical protein
MIMIEFDDRLLDDLRTRAARCPRPEKHVFLTLECAQAGLRRQRGQFPRDVKIEAYRCACGYWHLGHSSVDAEVAHA